MLKWQWAEYLASGPKTILALQPFRKTSRIEVKGAANEALRATLVDLSPRSNAWFLLFVEGPAGTENAYHLENVDPLTQHVTLDATYPSGLRIWVADRPVDCPLWGPGARVLEEATASAVPYASICANRLFVRNAVAGTYTTLERITNILRDHVWGGDRIVQFVRDEVYQNAFVEEGPSRPIPAPEKGANAATAPRGAVLAPGLEDMGVRPEHLAIDMGAGSSEFRIGAWYPVPDCPGILLSVIKAEAIAPGILQSYKQSVNALDAVESTALDYLVAFDLSRFDLGFEIGTDHPRVGWSERVLDSVRDVHLPGPDGIGKIAPLVGTGMLSPALARRAAATFAGGFKREHGAFRYGALAEQNQGSHYGFIEQGVILSKLQPDLAALIVTDDGTVSMRTWSRPDESLLEHIRFARENGVPLIETDASGISRPGLLVNRWGPGNWSGSSEEHLRTVRAGVCLQESGTSRYLIYGYFSDATPSAMARVFQAYGCRYAMHLDMNALEHTYLALYRSGAGQIAVEHLISGMSEVDRKGGEALAPRFIGFPDDRDFFYLLRKESRP